MSSNTACVDGIKNRREAPDLNVLIKNVRLSRSSSDVSEGVVEIQDLILDEYGPKETRTCAYKVTARRALLTSSELRFGKY